MENKSTEKTWSDIKKGVFLIFTWVCVLIVSLIFLNDRIEIFGYWCLITGIFSLLLRDKYADWYEKNAENIHKLEKELKK